MKIILIIACVVAGPVAFAQKISVKGQLVDSVQSPLPSATVLILNVKDSSLVNFGLTNQTGEFEVKNLTRQEYLFKVSYVGYSTITISFSASANEGVANLGIIQMRPEVKQLGEVVVEAERAPVVVKRDTIEFNATSFKTKDNAVVEDLLKKLPGIEVDNDGTIRAQGEQVQRVTVDGKTFFGNDPKLATRNLPADAIDKVQVFDKKSDQATFTGIDDGQKEKTINLSLKEEKRNAAFGTLQGGYGTDERFQLRASLNRFKKDQQISFLGMGNNVNDRGFGIDDYMSFTGGATRMAGGGRMRLEFNSDNQSGIPLNFGGRINGIMTNYAGGMNVNQSFSAKSDLNASYFYNQLEHDLNQTTERINYRANGDLRYHQNSKQLNTNVNHRVNLTLDQKLDSMNSIKFTNSFTYNESDANESSIGENYDSKSELENETDRESYAQGATSNLASSLLWRHKFSKKGRTLSSTLQFGVSRSDRDGTQSSTTQFYGAQPETLSLMQENLQRTEYFSYGVTINYTEPLGGRKYIEGNYSFRQNNNDVDRQVFDLISGESIFNNALSNQYTSAYQYHRGGVNFRVSRSNYNLVVGAGLQQTYLDGELKLLDAVITKSYQNFLPVMRFNYDFSNSKHFELEYETSVQEPTIQQLQPVVDNSDPLNLSVGNPNLRPAYEHNWRINFGTFNPMTFVSFFAVLETSYTRNAITTAQNFNEQQQRISQPVNVKDSREAFCDVSLSFPIEKIGSRVSVSANAQQVIAASVVDEVESDIAQTTIGGRVRYDYRYKDIFDLGLSTNISRQNTDYDFNEQANQSYVNQTYFAEANVSFAKHYQMSSSFEYLVYTSETTGETQSIPFLNASFSRFILKAKTGEIRLSVNNILDQKLGISQTADINFYQKQQANSLGRYFMVSFIYALNRQLNPMGMRPRGGMIRIMR
ncbi:TonB-dependent receptor family protein [Pseudochryseolinea flava]|uniref:TonB-dependent receptor n=1 Tax=Pseudochryseolinea flava TaxID=2059302 RepID=A0A364XZH3_9BACT|nr:TonB-dependent receptor family protein [Pseudochryseolinea flava]RAV99727.1 TonB-dependent receptor [Pseudochryseolinea flava]